MWTFIKFCITVIGLFFVGMIVFFFMMFKSVEAAELTQKELPQRSRTERLKIDGKRVTTVDEFGETRHNKPKYVVEENCLVPTDTFGIPKRNEGKVCFTKR